MLPPPLASVRILFVLPTPVLLLPLVVRFDTEVALARWDIGRAIVVFPMTNTPSCGSDIGVPETVTPGPPAVMVVPSMGKAVGFGVNVWPATV